MLCSKSEGQIPNALRESKENERLNSSTCTGSGKVKKRNTSFLTPEILVSYAREGEQAKCYEERYREAALGVFGTKRTLTHLTVPALLQTDKQAVIRQYHSDPCIASLGILQ